MKTGSFRLNRFSQYNFRLPIPLRRDLPSANSPPIGGSVRHYVPQLLTSDFYLLTFIFYL